MVLCISHDDIIKYYVTTHIKWLSRHSNYIYTGTYNGSSSGLIMFAAEVLHSGTSFPYLILGHHQCNPEAVWISKSLCVVMCSVGGVVWCGR